MARQPNDEEKKVAIDKKSGSLAYNRLDMQLSQTLHIHLELKRRACQVVKKL